MKEAEKKFKDVVGAKTEKLKIEKFKLITEDEQSAIWEVQEVMVKSMVEKIVKENGEVVSLNEFGSFFERMTDVEFAKLGEIAGAIVKEERSNTEKKSLK